MENRCIDCYAVRKCQMLMHIVNSGTAGGQGKLGKVRWVGRARLTGQERLAGQRCLDKVGGQGKAGGARWADSWGKQQLAMFGKVG